MQRGQGARREQAELQQGKAERLGEGREDGKEGDQQGKRDIGLPQRLQARHHRDFGKAEQRQQAGAQQRCEPGDGKQDQQDEGSRQERSMAPDIAQPCPCAIAPRADVAPTSGGPHRRREGAPEAEPRGSPSANRCTAPEPSDAPHRTAPARPVVQGPGRPLRKAKPPVSAAEAWRRSTGHHQRGAQKTEHHPGMRTSAEGARGRGEDVAQHRAREDQCGHGPILRCGECQRRG